MFSCTLLASMYSRRNPKNGIESRQAAVQFVLGTPESKKWN
ncbi:MAG: hypothetical protein N3D75_04790 [Candidatus Aenigmarchaeota archaeon]|nr:hypothetical protein [Candidatus Aenigmarchaeota archaeon]